MARHKCEKCGKTFDLKRYLTKHEQRHKNDKTPGEDDEKMEPLRCSMCDKVFPRLSHLQRHQLTHFNVRDFSCDFCDEKFVQKSHLTRHLARKHSDETTPTTDKDDITWTSCDKCGHLFRTLHEMKVHRKSSHTRFRCPRCSRTVEGADELRRHEMRCRNEQNQCAGCGASFGRRAELVSHQRTCQNKVAFVCMPCEEFFKQRVQLDRHIKKLHFRSAKCSNCPVTSESPVQNARHAMECQKIIICGYCNQQDPDAEHVAENHWQRLKRAMTIGKAKKETESRKNARKMVQQQPEDVADDSEASESDSEVAECSPRKSEKSEESSEDREENCMLLDNFMESTSSHLNFSSSAFAEDDDGDEEEEFLTFSIQPSDSEPTFYLRERLPEELKQLFPVLEQTSIMLLNTSSRSRMLVQVPVIIPKNGKNEEEMRKWLGEPIVLV